MFENKGIHPEGKVADEQAIRNMLEMMKNEHIMNNARKINPSIDEEICNALAIYLVVSSRNLSKVMGCGKDSYTQNR